jgi:hypothetical protein
MRLVYDGRLDYFRVENKAEYCNDRQKWKY